MADTVTPTVVTVRPDRLVAGGAALGRLDDGRVVFAAGVLPGETARVEVRQDRRDVVHAELADAAGIEVRSADRVEPPCRHRRAGCGGCDWMHLIAGRQLDAKVAIVAESLRRIGKFDASEVDRVVRVGSAVDPTGYRTSIRVTGLPSGGVGYREARSDDVVAVDSCDVAATRLSELLARLDVAPGVELSLRTSLATGAITAHWSVPRRRRRSRGRPHGEPATRRPVEGLPVGVHIGERAFLHERVAGVEMRVSAPSFFQSGVQAAELLVDAVGRAAPELAAAGHAVDAYGGVGLFATTLMDAVDNVTLVESSASACRDAEINLASASSQRAHDVVRSEFGSWRPSPGTAPVDVLVADPARSGLGRPGVAAVAESGAPVAVLVSCDPVSMARDAGLLRDAGHRLEYVEVIDLMPGTHHVETIARFVRDTSSG